MSSTVAAGPSNHHQAHEANMSTKTSADATCSGCNRPVNPKRITQGAVSPCCKRVVR